MSTHRFCTFMVNDLCFGVAVDRVQEAIAEEQAITHIPLAHPAIEGLMNLRGRIITTIDLRHRMDFEKRSTSALPMHVIIVADEGLVSLLVDSLGDVLEVDDASFEPPPETLVGAARNLVDGAYKLENKLLFVLNVEQAITVSHSQQ